MLRLLTMSNVKYAHYLSECLNIIINYLFAVQRRRLSNGTDNILYYTSITFSGGVFTEVVRLELPKEQNTFLHL